MRKVGLVIDSSFGLNVEEAHKLGFYYLPLILTIDGKHYQDGVDLTEEEVRNKLRKAKEVKTASPTLESINTVFEKALKECEHLVVHCLSMNLSSTYNNVITTINSKEEFKKRIHATKDPLTVSPWTEFHTKAIKSKVDKATSWESLIKSFDYLNTHVWGLIAPENLNSLIRGGRVSRLSGFVGNTLKIVPIVTFANGELESKTIEKIRGYTNAMSKTINNIKDKMLHDYDDSYAPVFYFEGDPALREIFKEKICVIMGIDESQIRWTKFGTVIQCHIGPDYMGGSIIRKEFL